MHRRGGDLIMNRVIVNGWMRSLRGRRSTHVVVLASMLGALAGTAAVCRSRAEDAASVADAAPDDAGDVDDTSPLSLPVDRGLERELSRARRLVERADWSSAAVAIDALLERGVDAFVVEAGPAGSRRSIRAEAVTLIEGLPRPGREAYQLLFRARAERALAEAVERGDAEGVVAVARRWFVTPAGRHAALIAAYAAFESGDRLSASGWLARLAEAAEVEPAVAVLQRLVGDAPSDGSRDPAAATRPVRIAGRELPLAEVAPAAGGGGGEAAAEWLQPGGGASRSTVTAASRPLVVPRYRVPLARHAEESRLLERTRRAAAPEDGPMMPAGGVIVAGGMIVTSSPLGVLGIDFETGKRIWLESARSGRRPRGDGTLEASLARVFEDATSGGLSSDGQSVFAVECHPDAVVPRPQAFLGGADLERIDRWRGGNTLTAYDLASGRVRWRSPGDEGTTAAGRPWYLGAPLVAGDDLFVLVEQEGRVRLDVLDASGGAVRWSQPLADAAAEDGEPGPVGLVRRLAGLTPAAASGVLVCPLGAGTVVAIDVASRDLLWSHRYRSLAGNGDAADAGGLFRGRSAGDETRSAAAVRGRDSYPVIAGDRVLLAAYDGDGITCLRLRDGSTCWRAPMAERVHVAGVVGNRVLVVGGDGAECLSVETGLRLWKRPHAEGVRTSGRGIVTPTSLFLPTDAPAVIELAIDDGDSRGEWVARGGVPGNLVACRGEIISRGIDSVEVFHQAEVLGPRVETAATPAPADAWASYWGGQLDLDAGRVSVGLQRLRGSLDASGGTVATADLVEALLFALRRDFPAAATAWREWHAAGIAAASQPGVIRAAVDGFLRSGEPAAAWRACRELLPAAAPRGNEDLLADPTDPGLEARPERWLRGRIAEIVATASPPLRDEITAEGRRLLGAARQVGPPARRVESLWRLATCLGDHPVGEEARQALEAEFAAVDPARPSGGPWGLRRSLLGSGRGPAPSGPPDDAASAAWPFGEVLVRRQRSGPEPPSVGSQLVALPLTVAIDPPVPGIGISYDVQQRQLLVADGFGRRLVEPLPIDPGGSDAGMPWIGQSFPIESSIVGRLLVVRTRAGVAAFDLAAAAGERRQVWRHAARQEQGLDLGLHAVGGRVARHAAIPLGQRITEPDEAARAGIQGPPAQRDGVLFATPGTVQMLDPTTGEVAWTRSGVPAVTDWVGDSEVVCGCTTSGAGCPVLSARDGRLLHRIDLPNRRQRLAAFGRRVVAVVPLDDRDVATRVRIEVIDPLDSGRRSLGEFAGESRATSCGGDRLVICEPDGRLTMLDGSSATVAWQARLPGLSAPPEAFHVMAWEDRYLVYASLAGTADGDDEATAALQSVLLASDATRPSSGAVWALRRDDGRPLWPAPAVVRDVGLHLAQPAGLPLLLFVRQTRADGAPRLSLFGLDKRSGHAVLDERRIEVRPHLFGGCDVTGDPDAGLITIRGANDTSRQVTLEYTGRAIAPRPPHQGVAASAAAASSGGRLSQPPAGRMIGE